MSTFSFARANRAFSPSAVRAVSLLSNPYVHAHIPRHRFAADWAHLHKIQHQSVIFRVSSPIRPTATPMSLFPFHYQRPTERMMPKSLWHTPTSCCSSQPQHPIRPVSQPRQPVIRYCSQLLLFWLLKVATLTRAYKIKHVTFMLYIPRRGRRRGHGSWCSPCCDFHLARTLSPGRSVFSLVLRYYAHSFIHSWRAIES